MDMNEKQLYEVPSTMVVEMKFEGVICQSGGTENYNRRDTQDW